MDPKIKQALDAMKGKPIEDFSGIMQGSLELVQFFIQKFFSDGQIDDEEVDLLCDLLDPMQAAAHHEKECRQVAYEEARSLKADLNKATKI